MTSTVEGPFGSQLNVNGYFLNNELTDFTFAPEKNGAPVANRVQAGKRPLSSMSPTIVYDRKGKPIFTVGAAGGRTIIMQVAKALIARLDWGLSAKDSIGLGLVFYSGDKLILEKGTNVEVFGAELKDLGHEIIIAPLNLKANAITLFPDSFDAAADPRSHGVALTQ
jgi:gamma-glutamyltranspeptidase/glutathione hydrolase